MHGTITNFYSFKPFTKMFKIWFSRTQDSLSYRTVDFLKDIRMTNLE